MSSNNKGNVPKNFFMSTVYQRMRRIALQSQQETGGNGDGVEHHRHRDGFHRTIDMVKWVGKIVGAATVVASLILPPLAYFLYGVNPLVCFAACGVGLFLGRTFMFLDEILTEVEACFWLLTCRFRGTDWEEMLQSDRDN
jgi:hypothetical protein